MLFERINDLFGRADFADEAFAAAGVTSAHVSAEEFDVLLENGFQLPASGIHEILHGPKSA